MASGKWSRQYLQTLMNRQPSQEENEIEKEFNEKFFKLLVEQAEKLPFHSKDVSEYLLKFKDNFVQKISGLDEEVRPLLVFSQACVETVLTSMHKDGHLGYVMGIIHTQCPATPVCVVPGDPVEPVVSATIRADVVRKETVAIRARVIRKMLKESGAILNIVYPIDGRGCRTQDQLDCYENLLKEEQKGVLFDLPLNCSKKDISSVEGATYIFSLKNKEDIVYAFTSRGRQANNPDDDSKTNVLGPINDGEVSKYVLDVLDFVENPSIMLSGRKGLLW